MDSTAKKAIPALSSGKRSRSSRRPTRASTIDQPRTGMWCGMTAPLPGAGSGTAGAGRPALASRTVLTR